jgi:hypothetical protein
LLTCPNRLQQGQPLLLRQLLLRQRAEVVVPGTGHVGAGAQRGHLAVAHVGLAPRAEGALDLLDRGDIQRVVRAVARDNDRADGQSERIEGRRGDLQLGQVVAVLAVAELQQAVLREDLGIRGRRGGVDAEQGRGEVVDADGVAIEVGLEGLPGRGLSQGVEDVGEAVVMEVQRPQGFPQAGLKGQHVLFDPGQEVVEAVVTLAGEEDEPDTDDLAEGELPLPEMVRREVAVEKLGHLQALQGGEQDGDIVHPFDAEHTRRCGVHGLSCKLLSPFREVPLSLSEREVVDPENWTTG